MKRSTLLAAVLVAIAALAAACGGSSNTTSGGGGGSSSSSSTGSAEAAGGRGGTLITRANAAPSGSPDPQVNYTLQEWQFLIITHDGLVGFKRASGPEGTKIVPDLATAVPTPTDNGKTYTFTLRDGIKFSTARRSRAPTSRRPSSACSRSATAPTRAAGTRSSRAPTRASRRRSPATSRRASRSTATK